MPESCLPEIIRVSTGSAVVLELVQGRMDAKPNTIYLLTYKDGKCSANCGFCPQANTSRGRADMLSRVTWPPFPTEQVLLGIERSAKTSAVNRICIQALNYAKVFEDLLNLAKEINLRVKVPLSISCQPLNLEKTEKLAEAGVDRISIALDAATEEVFDRVKGKLAGGAYLWERQREALADAVQIFGENHVTTHLIVGLGETEREMARTIQWCVDSGIYPGLFAFTPIPGTPLENLSQPSLNHYRKIQVAHYLITSGKIKYERMVFDQNDRLVDFGVSAEELRKVIVTGDPFLTSGCPGCNRPYYNEKPSGPLYNYPKAPLPKEIIEIKRQLGIL